MKQCPSCKTTYTDDTLSYCLADGSRLDAAGSEQPTQARAGGPVFADKTLAFGAGEKLRIDIEEEQARTNLPPVAPDTVAPTSGSGLFKILAVLAALLVLALLGVGGVGLLVYLSSKQDPVVSNKNVAATPLPTNSPRSAANDTDVLRDQIANLQRQLDEQKKQKSGSNVPLTIPNVSGTTTTAKANSPTDGFLALRSLPSTDIGDRVGKIPHGANVMIGACGPVVRSGSKSGRWCQARYGGMSGWVFDAYLTY